MKNLILLVITVFSLNAYAVSDDFCTIKGKSFAKNLTELELFSIANGMLKSHTKTTIDKDGNFAFMFIPEKEGFYFIGNDKMNNRFYLKKGDQLNLVIDKDGYHLVGKNSKENKIMFEWYSMSKDVGKMGVQFWGQNITYKDFFPALEKLNPEAQSFAKNINSGNSKFDNLMKLSVKWDLQNWALRLLYTPRSAHPKAEDYTKFYKELPQNIKFDNELLLENPYAVTLMSMYSEFKQTNIDKVKHIRGDDQLVKQLSIIDNVVLKGEMILSAAQRLESYNRLAELQNKYNKYLTTKNQQDRLHAIELELRTYKPGEKAINFTYPDKDGKKVSLSDFKGKVVLVDVWATWCGPCKKEIPHLEKLEKEYHGKDIVFLSVSVDEDKNKDKWLKMITEKNMGGVQLFVGGWSKITKDYGIKGIPRFMLFDKKGNIIDVSAPRPSNPKLKELINKYL